MKTLKSALITGGAKRIGKAIALYLAGCGYDIALHYNTSEKEAKLAKKEIEQIGQKCVLFQCNFSNLDESSKLIKKVKKSFPSLCLLVNNASIFKKGLFQETNIQLLENQLNVNFKTPFILSQDFAKLCKKGQIINLLDTYVVRKGSKYFAYNLSKKALYDLTKMAAYELGPDIRVNGIAPGPILPPFGKDDGYLKIKAKNIPLKQKGNTEYITHAVGFLLENNFITGECLFIDGGKHLVSP